MTFARKSIYAILSLAPITAGWAETPGFPAGNRPLANPYPAGNGAGGAPFFEEEESFDDEFVDPQPVGSNGLGNPDGENAGSGGIAPGNSFQIQAEGDAKAQVIPGARSSQQKAALVDDLGERGSSEVITDFNFPDADVLDIAKALGKLTGKNFILDKDVKGRISIISNTPVTVRDAWRAFLTALESTDYTIVPSGKFIRIMRIRTARDKSLPTFVNRRAPGTDTLITRLFKLKYLTATEFVRATQQLIPPTGRIVAYDQTNTVILTDTGSNAKKFEYLLSILDVETYDAGIEVVSVRFANAGEIAKLIDTLLPGTPANSGFGGQPRFGGGNQRFNARKTKEGGIVNNIIADDRTNTLIVHANSKGFAQVKQLVSKLDRRLPSNLGGGKIHVLYLQFADAEQLANTVNGLVSGQTGGAGARAGSPAGAAGGTGANPLQTNSSMFEGNVRIAADKNTNSLVVTANPTDYAVLKRVVERLDIPRDQVYSEVIIMEVSLANKFDFSANILSPVGGSAIGSITKAADLASFITNPVSSTGAIIGFKGGKDKTISIEGKDYTVGSIQGLVKLLQTRTNANVLATPTILSMDNTEGVFESIEKIPVRQTTGTQGVIGSSFVPQPVPLSIRIKPSINRSADHTSSEFIRLKIQAKLEDITEAKVPAAAQAEAIATISRSAETEVTVADSDTVVLGGLIRDTAKMSEAKVPLLGDIPVLGWLFKARSNDVQKSNTIIFITPKIIRQPVQLRAILDRNLKRRDDFLERSVGGKDLHRNYRDDLIRRLPDPKQMVIKNVESGTIDGVSDDLINSGAKTQTKTPISPDSPNLTNGQAPYPGYVAPSPFSPFTPPENFAPPPDAFGEAPPIIQDTIAQ